MCWCVNEGWGVGGWTGRDGPFLNVRMWPSRNVDSVILSLRFGYISMKSDEGHVILDRMRSTLR